MDVQKTGKFLVRNTARQLKIDDVAKKKMKKKTKKIWHSYEVELFVDKHS